MSTEFDMSAVPDVAAFLAHAVCLEEEAGLRFDELADSCDSYGNPEVSALFRKMAHFSRMHLKEARARAAYHDLPDLAAGFTAWGADEGPESASMMGADPYSSIGHALEVALASERAGQAFYQAVYDGTSDPEIRAMAREFAEEEGEHVAELERWVARHAAALEA